MNTSVFHNYQNYCVDYLLTHERCGLFLDMGLGKTAVTLKAIDELVNDSLEIRRVLVIAPLRVAKFTWSDEASKWEDIHLSVNVACGESEDRIEALEKKSDIVCTNRENVTWLYEHLVKTKRLDMFDMVVIDESSSFKNRKAKRWRSAVQLCIRAKRVVLLTGTPVPNGYQDLWSQIYLLDFGQRLGHTLTVYRENYFFCNDHGGRFRTYEIKPLAEDAIKEKINDLCVSMRSEDYLDLPELIYNNIDVVLPDRAMKTYRRMEKDMFVELTEGEPTVTKTAIEAPTAAAMVSKLLQIASGAIYDETGAYHTLHDAKTEALAEIIENNEGKPILVFYNYTNELARLTEAFAELEPRTLRTQQDIQDWNEGKIKLLLVNPASAGHGLNLQAGGHIIVWYSLTYNLEYYQQANKRLHRQGQTEAVVVHHLIAKGTVDESVLKILQGKEKAQDELMEYITARLAEMKDGKKKRKVV